MQNTIIENVDTTVDGVACLTLKGSHGALAPWQPGAHIDVDLPNWLTRQYSLCGDLHDPERYRIAVRHDPLSRGGSEYINLFLGKGQSLPVSLPRNHFSLEPAPSYLFIAGGIGITPILPMLQSATEAGATARLVYVGKALSAMPFAAKLQDRYSTSGQVIFFETSRQQRPDLAAIAEVLDSDTLVYCCGPESLLADAELFFPAARIRAERFHPVTKTFRPNTAFTARCARSGQSVTVDASTSLLDALLREGYPVNAGCREGVCGSCDVRVVGGQPEHRDDVGAPDGHMYVCVSRSLTPELVLDL